MKIKKIRMLNGYKRFHDLTIDLGDNPKRMVALVGPNGCGKSSVLDGLLFVHNTYHRLGNKEIKDYRYHSMNKVPNFPHTNVIIDFTNGSYAEVRAAKATIGQESTIFSFRSPYRYNSNLQVTQTQAMPEIRLNGYGASAASDLDDKMEQSYRRLYIKFNNYLNETNCRPTEAKEKIIGDLNASITKCIDLEISSIGNIESSQGSLYFRKKDHATEFEFNVLSSGEKEVVDILLDLYLRQDVYNDTVFLIDEPELHINTSIQRNLLIEINRLVGENCQIWITTHSIGFLRAIQGEMKDMCQVIQFKPEHELASTSQTLTPMETSRVNWRDVFGVALDDLAELVSPKRIIYCEGRDQPGPLSRERGLDAQVYNKVFSHKYPDTLFVSSGGNTELDQRSAVAIAILGKAIRNLEILVLKDRDVGSGKMITEEERLKYLRLNNENHRMLVRWEIENYLYDKEVLSEYCRKEGNIFDDVAYESFVTDVSSQNLKDATGRVKNLCGITYNISSDKFKIELSECIHEGMNVYREMEACIFGVG